MSHRATNWAIQQKGLKPATKIVLWHLADCHNPSHGCFPSQKYLAEQSELSDRAVRDHLKKLEECGLIERNKVQAESGFDRTEYTLNFDVLYTPPEKSSCGKNASKPPEKSSGPHRKNLPTNLVRYNPVKKPTRAREEDILKFYGDWINGDKPLPPSTVSGEVAQRLVTLGYVSKKRMRERVQ